MEMALPAKYFAQAWKGCPFLAVISKLHMEHKTHVKSSHCPVEHTSSRTEVYRACAGQYSLSAH